MPSSRWDEKMPAFVNLADELQKIKKIISEINKAADEFNWIGSVQKMQGALSIYKTMPPGKGPHWQDIKTRS